MANSVRQRWTVQKTHRSSAQRSQTAKLPVIRADTREIKKTRRRSKRHQPPHCNLPQTPMWKHIHPVCIPAKPPILDSPPPTKAQYAAMKRQRDREYALRLVAETKAKRLVSLICALRKNIRYAKNAREKVTASNETLMRNLAVLQLDLENSRKIRRTQEVHAHEEIQRVRKRAKFWRTRYRVQHRAYQLQQQRRANQAAKVYLIRKGAYTRETRRLVRELVGLGCPASSVRDILSSCARAWNLDLVGHLSSRTVKRAVEEGGIATKMQIGDVINKAGGESQLFCRKGCIHIN